MTEAPKRIWAWWLRNIYQSQEAQGVWAEKAHVGYVEYVRAGIAAERERGLVKALREAADELDGYYSVEYAGDHPYSVRKLAEAQAANPARAKLKELGYE